MNTNLKKFFSYQLIFILIMCIFSSVSVQATTLTVDQLYRNAYSETESAIVTKTQKSINDARTAISALSNTSARWAIGELSKQVDQVQELILNKIVQAILYAQENPCQTNVNAAKAVIDSELPEGWRASYSSAVDIVEQGLMKNAIDLHNKAVESKLQADIDAANASIEDIETSTDPLIVSWAKTIQERANDYIIISSSSNMQNETVTNSILSYDEVKQEAIQAIENRDPSFSFKYNIQNNNVNDLLTKLVNDITFSNGYDFYNIEEYDTSYSIDNGILSVTVNFSYRTTKEQEDYLTKQINVILSNIITNGMTTSEKELAIYNWIVNNTQYDSTYTIYDAYNTLVQHKGVCEGYALLAYRMLDQEGIPTMLVCGNANGGSHMWNLVNINGNWYHLDATWGSPVSDPSNLSNNYFNLTDAQMSIDHTWNTSNYPTVSTIPFSFK